MGVVRTDRLPGKAGSPALFKALKVDAVPEA
jgi:hypothetical protein